MDHARARLLRFGRRWGAVALPFVTFGLGYRALAPCARSIIERGVHVHFPYWLDKTLFGAGGPVDRASLNEVFALHHWPAVDFITGIAYLTFIYVVIAFAGYIALADGVRRACRFGWTFFAVNAAGLGTYVLCPVAPPWYVATHGFGPVDVATAASPAALTRWDAMTGIPYFQQFYAQASDVFGALPSLHCAYPALLVLFAWETRRPRLAATLAGYTALMAFSAVYLQHHYVTDVIAGMAYATAGYLIVRALASALSARLGAGGAWRGDRRQGNGSGGIDDARGAGAVDAAA